LRGRISGTLASWHSISHFNISEVNLEQIINNPTWWSLGIVCIIGFIIGFLVNLRWRIGGLVSIFLLMLSVELIRTFVFGNIPHSFIMNFEEAYNYWSLMLAWLLYALWFTIGYMLGGMGAFCLVIVE
jgi:hypothetical protein